MIGMPRGGRFYTGSYRVRRSTPKMRVVIYFSDRDHLDIHKVMVFPDADFEEIVATEQKP